MVCDMNNETEVNSEELKKIDGTFEKIYVKSTSTVAIYYYNSAAETWDKTDTAGSLFFYERNANPQYGLVVINRENNSNFLQTFGHGAEFLMESPCILVRAVQDLHTDLQGTHAIYCIWFFDPSDCIAAGNTLQELGLKFEDERDTFDKVGEQSESHLEENYPSSMEYAAGNHLFQILRKAKGLPINTDCNATTNEKS